MRHLLIALAAVCFALWLVSYGFDLLSRWWVERQLKRWASCGRCKSRLVCTPDSRPCDRG